MALSVTEISYVLSEITPVLTGGRVQKIHQPLPDVLTLDIRHQGKTFTLLLSARPETARLHLLTHRLSNPKTPPSFCQFLRAAFQGGRIHKIEQVSHDRIVSIHVATPKTSYTMIVALTGRQSNIVLLDKNQHVLRVLKPAHVKLGEPYRAPSPPVFPRVAQGAESSSHQRGLEGSRSETALEARNDQPFPVSRAIEERYVHQEEKKAHDQQRQIILAGFRKAIKKTQRRIAALSADIEKVRRYKEYGRYGGLLKSYLKAIAKGQSHITVVDYFDENLPELTIPLDPSKDAKWNLEEYFRKYRKYLGAEREIRPRLENATTELSRLQQAFLAAEQGELEPQGFIPQLKSKPPTPPLRFPKTPLPRATPYRRFLSADGFPILVGKTARGNETLTFQEAKSDDLWVHVRGGPGSHTIIPLEKGLTAPPETLRDAATLALLYSDLKKSGKGEVMYTLRKYVRKAKGREAGAVSVTREKSLWVDLDPERLKRLKASSS